MMSKTIAIIDFENSYNLLLQGHGFGWLATEFNSILNYALDINPETDYLFIRLYSGWMKNGFFTNQASRLQQAVTEIDFFPVVLKVKKKIIYGEVELVTRLFQMPELTWKDTVIERPGLPRLRIKNAGLPAGCVGTNENCPIRILYRFSKKRTKRCPVEGCNVTNDDAFIIIEQKMIDTMMACDMIAYSSEETVGGILVSSDDYDLMPPIAIATCNLKERLKKLCLIKNSTQLDHEVFDQLADMGCKIECKGN